MRCHRNAAAQGHLALCVKETVFKEIFKQLKHHHLTLFDKSVIEYDFFKIFFFHVLMFLTSSYSLDILKCGFVESA